jgi:RimJ/RimL family protein N-acetyltransferase
LLTAEAEGETVGSLGIEPKGGVGYLGMMVAAPWRGQGVGDALLVAALAWAREAGLHKLTLEVFPHNEAAIGLYRKHGFAQEGYLRRHERRASGELWDVVVMGLVLEER